AISLQEIVPLLTDFSRESSFSCPPPSSCSLDHPRPCRRRHHHHPRRCSRDHSEKQQKRQQQLRRRRLPPRWTWPSLREVVWPQSLRLSFACPQCSVRPSCPLLWCSA